MLLDALKPPWELLRLHLHPLPELGLLQLRPLLLVLLVAALLLLLLVLLVELHLLPWAQQHRRSQPAAAA